MITNEQLAKIREEQGEDAAKAAILKDREEAEKAKKQKARRENQNFTQIKPKGWAVLQKLMKEDANAARVYAFLAEHMGPDGTLAASRRTLAEALEIGERTVSRHIQTLVAMKSIIVLKWGPPTSTVWTRQRFEVLQQCQALCRVQHTHAGEQERKPIRSPSPCRAAGR